MNKRMMIWGGKLFQGLIYDESTKMNMHLATDCLSVVTKKCDIVNYSMKNLSVEKMNSYLENVLKYDNAFDFALLQIGDFDFTESLNQNISISTSVLLVHQFKENLQKSISLLKHNKITPILMTLPIMSQDQLNMLFPNNNPSEISNLYNKFNECITSLAKENELNIIDNNRLFKAKDIDKFLCKDGINVNESGHAVLGLAIKKTINHLL